MLSQRFYRHSQCRLTVASLSVRLFATMNYDITSRQPMEAFLPSRAISALQIVSFSLISIIILVYFLKIDVRGRHSIETLSGMEFPLGSNNARFIRPESAAAAAAAALLPTSSSSYWLLFDSGLHNIKWQAMSYADHLFDYLSSNARINAMSCHLERSALSASATHAIIFIWVDIDIWHERREFQQYFEMADISRNEELAAYRQATARF